MLKPLSRARPRRAARQSSVSVAPRAPRDSPSQAAPETTPGSSRATTTVGAPAVHGPLRAVGNDHPIAVLQAHSLPALVQREIERMILAGDLAAGAQLREAEVAAMLGVSRGPVREAFRALEESGLVRLEKNRGVFVRQISVAEADDIFELRAVLDDFAGRRAAQNATPAEAEELFVLAGRMEHAMGLGDFDAYHAANVAFHDRIVQLAANAKLTTLYRRLVNELHLHRRATLAQAGILPVSMREHRAIAEHIAARRPAAAGRALFEHAMASRDRVHRRREEPPLARRPRKVAR